MKTSHTLSEILFILSQAGSAVCQDVVKKKIAIVATLAAAPVLQWITSLSVLAVATTPLCAELIGQWPGYTHRGPARSVAVSGDLAYVAAGASLQVIDVLDSANPQRIGSVDFEDTVADVVVSGGHAYVATGASLEILDISQPSAPKRLGRYETQAGLVRDLVVSGNHAFLVIHDSDLGSGRLQIIDISNPEQPRALASYFVNAQRGSSLRKSLAVSGDLAFWAINGIGLEVIDISSPSEPVRVGKYLGNSTRALTVAVSGHYVLLGSGVWDNTLELLDVSNPSQPQKVDDIELNDSIVVEIVISNSLAFVAKDRDFLQFELSVIDLSEPTNLAVISRYEGGVSISSLSGVSGVAVSGSHAYLATGFGLEAIDISDPANPEASGRYRTIGDAKRVIVSGDYAILASRLSGFQAIDVSEPSAPKSVGGLETFNVGYWNPLKTVAVSDNFVFLKSRSEIEVVDISDPLKMTSVATYWSADTNDITVVGDYAYLSGGSGIQESRGWLEVIDIRDLNNLQRIGRLETSTVFTGGLAVLDNFAYIVGWRGLLLVIDVSDPRHPELAGRYEDEDAKAADSLAVSGNYVYMRQSNGLAIIDVSNPARPERVGFYPIDSPGTGRVILSGQHVYFAAGSAGLHVVDVSDPASPVGVAFYDSPGLASDVWIAGNHVYLADGNSGLAILELFQKPRFEITGRNPFRLSISGAWNTRVQIQRSSNLLDWEDWQSLILGEEPLELSDATADEMGTQFYRVVSP